MSDVRNYTVETIRCAIFCVHDIDLFYVHNSSGFADVAYIDAGDLQSASDGGTTEEGSDREPAEVAIEEMEEEQSRETERKKNTTLYLVIMTVLDAVLENGLLEKPVLNLKIESPKCRLFTLFYVLVKFCTDDI